MSMNTLITLEVKFYSAVLCDGLGLGLETKDPRSCLVSSFLKGLDNNTVKYTVTFLIRLMAKYRAAKIVQKF